MKEPHSEGVANHADLESCAGGGDIAGEALTEALAGRLSSREIPVSGADLVDRKGRPYQSSRYRKRRANPARSETPCTSGNSSRENRETSATSVAKNRPAGKGASRTPRMHVGEESEREVVPRKDSNKNGQPSAESREGSNRAEENVQRPRTDRARKRAAVSQGLEGVRQAARRKTTGKFTSLLHHLTPELLRSSFYG